MTSVVYLNGAYVNAENAKVSVFDRGLLFGDAVYEVIPVYNGHPCFVGRHLKRLRQNLSHAKINCPDIDWLSVFQELSQRNGGGDLQIYLQITRGNQGVRKHDIPKAINPTFFAFTIHSPYPNEDDKRRGLHANIVEDFRWMRCDIKTTAMLANILLNDAAVSQGADTAILSRDGFLTEGSASNVFIVDKTGLIKTPPLDKFCLPGITRQLTIKLVNQLKLAFSEEPIPIEDLYTAKEVWITSTTKGIYPVTRIDQQTIGSGVGGQYWEQLEKHYQQLVEDFYDK